MAAFAETLVDEWMNREGFFTIRGLRRGVQEIDLLGVRQLEGRIEGWHVEVQASIRPIGYIARWLPQHIDAGLANGPAAAGHRTPEIVKECAVAWVARKFDADVKVDMRNRAWPNLTWDRKLVHAVVLSRHELQCIRECGVATISLRQVIQSLRHPRANGLMGVAGTDVAEILTYLNEPDARDCRREV